MNGRSALSKNSNFGHALKSVRVTKNVIQDQFEDVSNRTYVSAVERGIKQPTLPKVDEFAAILAVHPLTLLVLAYLGRPTEAGISAALETVQQELGLLAMSGLFTEENQS